MPEIDDNDEGPAVPDQKIVALAYAAGMKVCTKVVEISTIYALDGKWFAMVVDDKNVGHRLNGTIA